MQKSLVVSLLLFGASCLTLVPLLPRRQSFVVFGVVFVGTLAWLWRDNPPTITFHPAVLVGTLLVWIALTVGFVRAPSMDGLLRLGAFVVVSGTFLFVLPSTLSVDSFYRAVGWIAAALVVVGLPAVFLGRVGPTGIWVSGTPLLGAYIPTSLFDNPNILGYIATMGSVAAAGRFFSGFSESRRDRSSSFSTVLTEVLATLCMLGTALAEARGAIIALYAGLGVLIVAWLVGRRAAAAITVLGIGGLAWFMLTATRLLPGPGVFHTIDLSGRGVLWRSSLRAAAQRPLFGWGPGADAGTLAPFVPSESRHVGDAPGGTYVRMFFIGGLVGGIGYLLLSVGGVWTAFRDGSWDPTTAAMVVVISVGLIFEGSTVFGLNPISVVGAFVIGVSQLRSPASRSISVAELATEIRSAVATQSS